MVSATIVQLMKFPSMANANVYLDTQEHKMAGARDNANLINSLSVESVESVSWILSMTPPYKHVFVMMVFIVTILESVLLELLFL